MHFSTPFYRASVNILIRTKGTEFSRHCDSCHNPIGVLSEALTVPRWTGHSTETV